MGGKGEDRHTLAIQTGRTRSTVFARRAGRARDYHSLFYRLVLDPQMAQLPFQRPVYVVCARLFSFRLFALSLSLSFSFHINK